MITRFPVAPQGPVQPAFLNQLLQQLRAYFNAVVSHDEEVDRIILRSPNGSLFDVRVSNAGAVVITPAERSRA